MPSGRVNHMYWSDMIKAWEVSSRIPTFDQELDVHM